MPLISVRHKGNFKKTESYFAKLQEHNFLKKLDQYGQMGVEALQAATPVRTGKTADKIRVPRYGSYGGKGGWTG